MGVQKVRSKSSQYFRRESSPCSESSCVPAVLFRFCILTAWRVYSIYTIQLKHMHFLLSPLFHQDRMDKLVLVIILWTILIKDVSSTEGVVQRTVEVNSSRKMVDRTAYLWASVLFLWFILFHCCAVLLFQNNDTTTDAGMIYTEKKQLSSGS